jgi:putative MATE family efflux protein
MRKKGNMTDGGPLGLYVSFAVPVIASNVFYQLYTLVDGVVASRVIGIGAFAAISAAGFFYMLIVEAVLGFSQGAGTRFAQLYGAADYDKARNSAAVSVIIAVAAGAVLGLLCMAVATPVLTAMHTPPEIMGDALTYLYCMFAGLVPTFLYRLLSSVFYGMGDSRAPLAALVIGSVTDTVLTVVLALTTPLGVAAIGLSTVFSQLIAAAYLIIRLFKSKELRFSRPDFRITLPAVTGLLRISLPNSARNAVSALGGVVIQYFINGYGVAFIAGVAAAKRLYVVLFFVMDAMEPAISTFIAQNFGAGRLDRVKAGMTTATRIILISSASIMVLMFFFGEFFLGLLIGNGAEIAPVMAVALGQLRICLILLPTLYLLILYRSGLQGLGKTSLTLASGLAEGGLRIAAILLLPRFLGETGVYISEVIGWPVCAAMLFGMYMRCYRGERQALDSEASS